MLMYALIFLIVAIILGVLGFGSLSGTAALIAKVLVVVFSLSCLWFHSCGARNDLSPVPMPNKKVAAANAGGLHQLLMRTS